MKRTNLLALIATCTLPTSVLAADIEFVAKDSSLATKTCIAAASNNVSELKMNTRRGFDNNYRLLSETLSCNGLDINSFAHAFGASNTNALLNNRVSRKYRIDDNVDIIDISGSYPPLTGKVQVIVSGK
ncbi:DUF3718 domain-containing protein [Thalassotalea litorea]|nr:DUF3718 domain-containing protein [Thalassotalea litorea]